MQTQMQGRAANVAGRRQQVRATRASRANLSVRAVASGGAKPTVLVSEKLGEAGIDILKEFATVDCSYNLTPEQLCAKISLCDALIVRSATKVTRAVFEASKGRLKVVGRAGVGIDNVDLAAATEYGCLVVNAPTANTIAAAEHGIALMLAMARNVAQADASMKKGVWDRNTFVGTSITGKTLAIIGFGKVGSEVARRAKGLGMEVIAYDPYASAEKAAALGVQLVSMDEALATGDFFSLHMPLLASTKNLFNEAAFNKIKRGARIINVARGGVIDEDALVKALDAGQVAQAALDVFAEEPPKFATSKLVGRSDVIVTPHMGASTAEAQEGVAFEIVEAVVDALQGKLSQNAVNAPMVPAEILKELQPFIALAQGLGRAAVSLVADSGFSELGITYSSPRGDDLDTRLLRANVLKGVLDGTTASTVNLVNADLLAKNRGLKITEVTIRGEGSEVLTSMSVALGSKSAKFSGAVDKTGRVYVEGQVRNGQPFITKIGSFDVELAVTGSVLLTRQLDQPGIVSAVSTLLAEDNVNISFMTVGRTGKNKEAIMAIGIDSEPSAATMAKMINVKGIQEAVVFAEGGK
eukprot:CAMPEP_0119102720 /NCGR_PEP_ID=MMETSP1180-20130426/1359_1 /TAXON_ID=3052 ORGANISM="Chlamydomonas cf sp, Strain CCMP681" /NCGR_SAMPLE_ID=MMETSP1180 /ASSEMBLY_ACC=CAM_ASM_000741 /LENGTH=582 /DNA_ID=CAMNT_0007087047 /DNA_START=100 /DNA_END=1848 /DNA_ORIENTATION=+